MSKKTKTAKKPTKTPVQEEITGLGVIVNIMLGMDSEARARVVNYLGDRFGNY